MLIFIFAVFISIAHATLNKLLAVFYMATY